jgi:hypothetical protein
VGAARPRDRWVGCQGWGVVAGGWGLIPVLLFRAQGWSGQDVERGTFSHRHAVLHDQETAAVRLVVVGAGVQRGHGKGDRDMAALGARTDWTQMRVGMLWFEVEGVNRHIRPQTRRVARPGDRCGVTCLQACTLLCSNICIC